MPTVADTRDSSRGSDASRLPEEVVAAYDTPEAHVGELVFQPTA